uniref:Transcription repressor n=1 Tax=Leersia perrieri TaxID=77586 RepID=A0A0D9XJY0_9ORYZ
MLSCFPAAAGRRRALPPAVVGVAVFEEAGSISAASTSVGTGSPPSSSASTSSPAFLDDLDPPLYLDDDGGEAEVAVDAAVGGLSTAIASRRLFLDSPGMSNSIVDCNSVEHAAAVPGGGGASSSSRPRSRSTSARPVEMTTTNPRGEFLKSMEEMVEAMGIDVERRGGGDRARLHELLLCYIALNDRDALPDILAAFTDLLFSLKDGDGGAAAADGGATGKREA